VPAPSPDSVLPPDTLIVTPLSNDNDAIHFPVLHILPNVLAVLTETVSPSSQVAPFCSASLLVTVAIPKSFSLPKWIVLLFFSVVSISEKSGIKNFNPAYG
jgi:hypothetical protein